MLIDEKSILGCFATVMLAFNRGSTHRSLWRLRYLQFGWQSDSSNLLKKPNWITKKAFKSFRPKRKAINRRWFIKRFRSKLLTLDIAFLFSISSNRTVFGLIVLMQFCFFDSLHLKALRRLLRGSKQKLSWLPSDTVSNCMFTFAKFSANFSVLTFLNQRFCLLGPY